MKVDIEQLNRKYFYKNKPVKFKLKCGEIIKIYPILVRDWDVFEESYDILTFPKNDIPSPEIISMKYMDFMISILLMDEINQIKLSNVLSLCLKFENIKFGFDNNNNYVLNVYEEENYIHEKFKIFSKDFDDIKKIILYQNIVGYDDTLISKDIKNLINDYHQIRNENIEPLTLEKKIIFLGNEIGMTTKEILDMTYREFSNRFDMAVEKLDYQIYKTAEMSGNVKFDKKIEHLIYKSKKNKFEEYFVNKDEFTNKINNA